MTKRDKKKVAIAAIIAAIYYFFFRKKKLVGTVEGGIGDFGKFGTEGDFVAKTKEPSFETPSYFPLKMSTGMTKGISFRSSVKPSRSGIYEKGCCGNA